MTWHKSPPWLEDRFMLFLVLATALHALVLLGVSFGVAPKPAHPLAKTLEIVLVKWRSEEAPEEADFLAQASQRGGGEVSEKIRPTQPSSGEAPTLESGRDALQSTPATAIPEKESREIIAQEVETAKILEQTRVEQFDTEQPSVARLMRQSMDLASLQPELNRQIQWKSKLPVRKFISANTQEYEFASYMRAWVAKVERVGNLNYPSELRRKKLHGDLVLTVGIRKNGTVESIDIMRSSGVIEVDQAAVRIVRMCAPYSHLPDNISRQVDILHITRTWRFETGFGVE